MSDDNDDELHIYEIEEIVFGLLALMAPPEVRSGIVRLLETEVSRKAADKARELLDETEEAFDGNPAHFIKDVCASLSPELRGPRDQLKIVQEFEQMVSQLVSSGVIDTVIDGGDHIAGDGIQAATPGCECLRCKCLRSLEDLGVEIYRGTAGPSVNKKDLN